MLTLSFLGLAGIYMGCSNQFAPRFVRGFLAEIGRPITSPHFTPTPGAWDANALTACWLGHSTVLLNFYGVNILTDPVLCRRIGAHVHLGTVGPKRLVAPALTLPQLPPIDLILLSHAHMDHLDLPTLGYFSASTQVVTAQNTSDLLVKTKLKKVTELSWGEKAIVRTRHGSVHVEAFEVRHWGARWQHDKYRGYNGYILEREGKKFIFGGDTALCRNFRNLRPKGPFELAIMPIGSYKPWLHSHCNPEQAVFMANNAGAKYLLPIHFKTFILGKEGQTEPMKRLSLALEKERIALRDIGETFTTA